MLFVHLSNILVYVEFSGFSLENFGRMVGWVGP